MPARSERIYLCPHKNGQPGWIMDFPAWWSRSGFFETYGAFDKPGSRWFDTGNTCSSRFRTGGVVGANSAERIRREQVY